MSTEQFGRRRIGGNERTVTPLYHQVYVALRQKIRDGALETDQPLPGENQLALEFGVSRVTIRKALANLELDGFITKRCGIGSFPVAQPVEFRDRYNIGGLLETGPGLDTKARMKTVSIDWIETPAQIAERLAQTATETTSDVKADPRVLRLIRVRSVRGEPFTLMTAYFPSVHATNLDRGTLKTMAPPVALESNGVSMERAEQRISATVADEATAPLLNVPVGTPLILIGTVFFDEQDCPALAMESLYRPDLYEYRSMMRRDHSGRWQSVL